MYTGIRIDQSASSVPAIALKSSNEHGEHYYMSLYSGKRSHSYGWDELPIYNEVIARVEELATLDNESTMVNYYSVFTCTKRGLEHPSIESEEESGNEEEDEEI